jgi:anti-anti-sigma factor
MISHATCRAKAAHVVVSVQGPDLDLTVAEALHSTFSALAPQDPQTVVVVDLSLVTFMDCAGLGPCCEPEPDSVHVCCCGE